MAAIAPDISPEAFVKVATVLERWGANHPLPDVAVIATSETSSITPREISSAMTEVLSNDGAVDKITPPAKTVRVLFSAAVFEVEVAKTQAELIEELLEEFRKDIERWSGSDEPGRVR